MHITPGKVGGSALCRQCWHFVGRWMLLCVFAWCCGTPLWGQSLEEAFEIAPGFEVTQYAGDELCHDVFSLTMDSRGRVVVSGPGYVRILEDTNQDGKADRSQEFVAGPQSGAQGMFFYGPDLLCTGDAGLLRYKDRNGDDKADGPPDVFLRAKAGTEHDIHAVRQGPDGWWYVIAGNSAEIDERYITLPTSPIKKPFAGTMVRLKPDLSGGEVVADGIRNAYDFDFSLSGDLFVFDSDGERDLSLPWYQPTRVFQVLPGSNLGWGSNSLIRPSDSFDMPPTLAELGRSSPTGVVCYRHYLFPARYHGALFVLDWTFGRVWALPLEEDGATWKSKPTVFLKAAGDFGFAPTDAEVGPDGALYVCIGGRGTRGGVYRIVPKGSELARWNPPQQEVSDKLDACLRAPQPLASWSRAVWEPLAKQLGPEAFRAAALSKQRPTVERLRAVEILTEKFAGLAPETVRQLALDANPMVRARTAWSLGRREPQQPPVSLLLPFVNDKQPQVARQALEALIGADEQTTNQLAISLGKQAAHPDPVVRLSAQLVLARCSSAAFQQAAPQAINQGWQGALPVAAAYARRHPGVQNYPLDIGTRLLKSNQRSQELRADAVRLIQMGLGDVGSQDETLPPAFEAYCCREALEPHAEHLHSLRQLVPQLYPSGNDRMDRELERLAAMLQLDSSEFLTKLLEQTTPTSDPVRDIQRLIVATRLNVTPDEAQRPRLAALLVGLEAKMQTQGLPQDSSWDDRLMEVYKGLVKQDAALAEALLEQPEFGDPGHVQFASQMPPNRFQDVLAVFLKRLEADPDFPWSNDLVFLLAQSQDQGVREMVRGKFADFSLRNAVITAFADAPQEGDRHLFVEGLETAQVDTLLMCIQALSLLRPSQAARENVMLVRTLRRLGYTEDERQARDQVAELLQLNLQENFGYQLARDGDPQQVAVDKVTAIVRNRFAEEYAQQVGESAEEAAKLEQMLTQIPWHSGRLEHGQQLFQQRGCIACHGGRKALGPDLIGVTGRFSKEDLFTAIAFPHRDVSPRYQTTQIATYEGHVRTGLVVYEYPDAVVLRDAQNQTYRINTSDIEIRRTLNKSLMPEGLLKGLGPQDVADLYSYLRSMGEVRTAARPEN